jgi:hypothetical protein
VQAVWLSNDGFSLGRDWQSSDTAWEDIAQIRGVQMQKLTYDECFLIFVTKSSASLSVGELDRGFEAFEAAVLDRFPSVPLDWRSRVEVKGFNNHVVLWPDAKTY